MARKVSAEAVKISLLQTLPGREFEVADGLIKACSDMGIENFAIFKGFGIFDIIFISAAQDFSPVLTPSGPIDGILTTSRFFCFEYDSGINQSFFLTAKDKTFISLSFIKINTDSKFLNYESEKNILDVHFAPRSSLQRFAFGAIGWNELILAYVGDDINEVVASSLSPNIDGALNLFHKTYSILGLNYGQLPHKSKSASQITKSLLANPLLKNPVDKKVTPSISIVSYPIYCNEIYKYWDNKKYKIFDAIGKEDFRVIAPPGILWNRLLSDLISFRFQFKNKISSTITSVTYAHSGPRFSHVEVPPASPLSGFDYTYEEYSSLFPNTVDILSETLNTLRGLTQNTMIQDAFGDMLKYPAYIKETARKLPESLRENFSAQTNELLVIGAELRLYGTYGTVEENVGQFNKLRGGVHRSLNGLGYLPLKAMNEFLGKDWQGFISIGNQQFANVHDIITVPVEAAWNPEMWWAMNHEIAHMLLDYISIEDDAGNTVGLIDGSLRELKLFLGQKNYPEDWLMLVVEMAAEYIGYQLAFYSDYDLFLRKLWTYIKGLAPKKTLFSPLSIYAIRTYFVHFYERYFTKECDRGPIKDLDHIYEDPPVSG